MIAVVRRNIREDEVQDCKWQFELEAFHVSARYLDNRDSPLEDLPLLTASVLTLMWNGNLLIFTRHFVAL